MDKNSKVEGLMSTKRGHGPTGGAGADQGKEGGGGPTRGHFQPLRSKTLPCLLSAEIDLSQAPVYPMCNSAPVLGSFPSKSLRPAIAQATGGLCGQHAQRQTWTWPPVLLERRHFIPSPQATCYPHPRCEIDAPEFPTLPKAEKPKDIEISAFL